ncbi:galactose-specific lectin nattectin-like [Megalobrama amblycephala]|uniref:galactose-specific lectin nattectin-like n=1 Tax=Megalobrama amblycephala TaxID=75352 RepID=UPI002013E2F9|nr:galactose-specific lectin nattectin-like [Megalobrama amblycephala]XP_048016001.1 galactose-specific lectin nattectin-like [Megalobrama amblycephala]
MAVWTVYLSICLLVALNASVETRPVEINCGACATGWTAFGCRCFKFYNELRPWASAEYACSVYYKGNLASVHSHAEYMFIKDLIRRTTYGLTPTWIGGRNAEGLWFWSDGTEINYKIWSPGQPSNGKDELCVEMNSVNGNWNDVNCREDKPFVCVK